jgi:5-methyltetrahydropteroyltriglutamate--homocysteine methyltransferase
MSVRTTVVGSWWPLPEHEADLRRYHDGQLSEDEGERVLERAAAAAIAEQRALGLDEWTGGEYHTDNFIYHMHKMLTGIEVDAPGADEAFDYDDMVHGKIVGDIDAPNGLGYVRAFERENRLDGGVTKATVVSPIEVAVQELDQFEQIMQSQLDNLERIVNKEMRELADAGCPNVQLDAPILGILVNDGAMDAKQVADILAPCFEGVNARKSLHICNGNMKGRPKARTLAIAPWVEILKHLDGVVDVAVFEAKYFSQWEEREAFREMPQSMELAAGIIDEANYWPEPVDKVRQRAAEWARVVGEERLWLAPSCGFGRHAARDIPVLREKMENMMEAARTL